VRHSILGAGAGTGIALTDGSSWNQMEVILAVPAWMARAVAGGPRRSARAGSWAASCITRASPSRLRLYGSVQLRGTRRRNSVLRLLNRDAKRYGASMHLCIAENIPGGAPVGNHCCLRAFLADRARATARGGSRTRSSPRFLGLSWCAPDGRGVFSWVRGPPALYAGVTRSSRLWSIMRATKLSRQPPIAVAGAGVDRRRDVSAMMRGYWTAEAARTVLGRHRCTRLTV
jgi:hypothetical protein